MAAQEGLDSSRATERGRGVALAERRQVLTPEPLSSGHARRLVREALADASRDGWCDVAELVVSEVVTNATLHAHTPIEVWVGVYADEVCVEVRDFDPTLPIRHDYDLQATTGRGMGLVSTLARACGVRSLRDDGKIVWFCVGDDPAAMDPEALLAAWDVHDLLGPGAEASDVREVVLASMPATLWLSAGQHHDAILRELILYLARQDGLAVDVASADAARSTIATAVVVALEEARAAGTAEPPVPAGHPSPLPWVPKQLDLRFGVPADAAGTFATLQDVLDVAERLAAKGDLLIRPGLPEIVAVRDWACEQVIAQLAGNSPAPWPGTDQARFERHVDGPAAAAVLAWDAAAVTGATTGVIAADDANRIVAISEPLAALLGWRQEDLVGRRVVTVIPPALREAHIAGFSRHLSTGEAHVIGIPLDLPVLRRDGTEVRCRFLVERAPDAEGRGVYLAWIDPIDPVVPDASARTGP